MKLYKIKDPQGRISTKSFSRALAFRKAKELSRQHGKEYKPFVFVSDVINHDHELTKSDTRYYEVKHYEVITP